MAIKMRVNNKKSSVCEECGCKWDNTYEMYDMVICDTQFTLCKTCMDTLFNKTLKLSCMYDGKLKSQEDIRRTERARRWRSKYGKTVY